MSSVPWKEASSLIILARKAIPQMVGLNLGKSQMVASRVIPSDDSGTHAARPTSSADYKVLMVKRSNLSSFMASAYVFPGGQVELADYSCRWWSVFGRVGTEKARLASLSKMVLGPRPPMVVDPVTLSNARQSSDQDDVDHLPADIGLRIGAIRETFEETGVLLLTAIGDSEQYEAPISDSDTIPVDLSLWRDKVRKDANAFIDLCLETGLCPDIWSLYEWSNWLTPISVGHKRFDTMFYICCLEKQPKVVLDNTEITTLKWCSPLEILEEHIQEKVFLAPPQVYELSRIQRLPDLRTAKEFAKSRQTQGCERWLPVLATYKDGAISLLPGDDAYPEEVDIIGKKPVPDYPQTLEEMRSKAQVLNRLELRGSTCNALCNTQLPRGHLSPISVSETSITPKSML